MRCGTPGGCGRRRCGGTARRRRCSARTDVGRVGLGADVPGPSGSGITSTQSLVALGDGISKLLVIPGLKVNLKGKMLLSLNAIVTIKNNGLHATITPVAGINLTK